MTSRTTLFCVTTRDEASDIFSGLEAGANDYVRKPFNQDELFARIRVGQRTLELQNRLYETQQMMFRQATYDTLTEVYNRRVILDQLSRELSRVQRSAQTVQDENLCIGYFDIDHFKQINDIYGHQAGDEVIKTVTQTILAQLRAYDVLGRLGGDEFLLLAPGVGVEHKIMLFDRLCKVIAQTKIKTAAGEITTTISIGVTIASPNQSADHLLARADAAMYQAKKAGGGRVFWAESSRDG